MAKLQNNVISPEMRDIHFRAKGTYESDEAILAWYNDSLIKADTLAYSIQSGKEPNSVESIAKIAEESGNFDLANKLRAMPAHKTMHVGTSDYSKHTIQPWDIWREYSLNPWDADIVKRVLRTKKGDSRKMDYEKIIHICQECIAQLDGVYDA